MEFYGKSFLAGVRFSSELPSVFLTIVKIYNEFSETLLQFFLQNNLKQLSDIFARLFPEANSVQPTEAYESRRHSIAESIQSQPKYNEYLSFNPKYENLKPNTNPKESVIVSDPRPLESSRSKSVEIPGLKIKEVHVETKNTVKTREIKEQKPVQPLVKLSKIAAPVVAQKPQTVSDSGRNIIKKYVKKTEKAILEASTNKSIQPEGNLLKRDAGSANFSSRGELVNLSTRNTDGRDHLNVPQRVQTEPSATDNPSIANFRLNLNEINPDYKRGKSQPNFQMQKNHSATFREFESNSTSSRVLLHSEKAGEPYEFQETFQKYQMQGFPDIKLNEELLTTS